MSRLRPLNTTAIAHLTANSWAKELNDTGMEFASATPAPISFVKENSDMPSIPSPTHDLVQTTKEVTTLAAPIFTDYMDDDLES
jgi:hypothetical protein